MVLEIDDLGGRRWLAQLHDSASVAAPRIQASSTWKIMRSAEGATPFATGPNNEAATYREYPGHDELPTLIVPAVAGIDGRFGVRGYWVPVDADHYTIVSDFPLIATAHSVGADFPMKSEIEEIAQLHDGWDGPGSVAPSADAVLGARNFVMGLTANQRHPDVAAGQDGEINVSWRDSASFIDLSFYGAEGASLYARIDNTVFKTPSVSMVADLPSQVLNRLAAI